MRYSYREEVKSEKEYLCGYGTMVHGTIQGSPALQYKGFDWGIFIQCSFMFFASFEYDIESTTLIIVTVSL